MSRAPGTLPPYSVARKSLRAHYDEATVHDILDHGMVAHVGFVAQDRPMVIPMAYVRADRSLYLHGASTTRIVAAPAEGAPICATVTHVDGIVVARSAFNHSLNYRSVVVHGTVRRVEDPAEHEHALRLITDHLLPGRWAEVRPMLPKERRATGVISLEIEAASAKVRTGGPVDDADDRALDIWGGVLPLDLRFGAPVPDEHCRAPATAPASVAAAVAKFTREA